MRRLWLAVLLACVGCAESDVASTGDDPVSDALEDTPTWPLPPAYVEAWEVSTVADFQAGGNLRLAVGGDRVALAWFGTSAQDDGPCEELPDEVPPTRKVYPLWYAESKGDAWDVEKVMDQLRIDPPVGLDLAFGADGLARIATQVGEPVVTVYYCGVNDVALLRRDGAEQWFVETAVVTSGEAVTGEAGSDYGEVVGLWPALAFDDSGEPAIAYKDVHAGSVQGDDFNRADMELTRRSGQAWAATPVDFGRGAGDYNDLVFDDQDRAVVLYGNPTTDPLDSAQGLWVAREVPDAAVDEDPWQFVRLREQKVLERPSIALGPEDVLHVVFYDPDKGVPVLATLPDPEAFTDETAWTFETFGDPSYDEGIHPSMGFDADGNLAVAYYRCCAPADDGVVLAVRREEGWERELVAPGGDGLCGTYPNLAFSAAGPIVAFQCAERQGEQFQFTVQVARPK